MNKSHRFLVTVLLIGAYLLSACSGAMPGTTPGQDDTSSGAQFTEVVFTGNVEAMDASQWTISGQVVSVEGASIDPAIKVGDIVKVEAKVAADGSVFALRIEVSRPDGADDNANDNMNDNANDNMNDNANDNMNDNDDNANDNMNGNDNASDDDEQEVYGVVEALSADSITVNGMTYVIASFTEFKTIVAVGDYVKLHLMAGSDGSLIVREIEKKSPGDDGNDNANGNAGYDDDNDNSNSNSNYNDNSNSNDNDDDDDNGNSNSNDNDDDDDNGNSNSNDNDDNDNGNSNGDD
ncbi:MAG: DUF5666 domain-containing protein [Chloroflexota bacterium]